LGVAYERIDPDYKTLGAVFFLPNDTKRSYGNATPKPFQLQTKFKRLCWCLQGVEFNLN